MNSRQLWLTAQVKRFLSLLFEWTMKARSRSPSVIHLFFFLSKSLSDGDDGGKICLFFPTRVSRRCQRTGDTKIIRTRDSCLIMSGSVFFNRGLIFISSPFSTFPLLSNSLTMSFSFLKSMYRGRSQTNKRTM